MRTYTRVTRNVHARAHARANTPKNKKIKKIKKLLKSGEKRLTLI